MCVAWGAAAELLAAPLRGAGHATIAAGPRCMPRCGLEERSGGREDNDAKAGEDGNGKRQTTSGAEHEMGNILRVAGSKNVYWAFHYSDGLVRLHYRLPEGEGQ